VHHIGLACHDIAAIHTGSPNTRGSVVRYNWVHHSMGKGIRGDDQTRKLTVHHNVVWLCDEGIIAKGDDNKVYHNTIIGADGHGALLVPTRTEPKKWWTPHPILQTQNEHSLFFNNYCEGVVYRHEPIPQNKGISHNLANSNSSPFEETLVDVAKSALEQGSIDPRPRSGVFLIDAGKIVPGLTVDYVGKAPDVGAYEYGKPMWHPGSTRSAPDDSVLAIDAEIARSHTLQRTDQRQSIPIPKKLLESKLSDPAKQKLQSLFDKCWTDDEISRRHAAILKRKTFPEQSAEYQEQHAVVVKLHREATSRLIKRAHTVLSEDELELFDRLMRQ
jgi:hypothetical protein